MEVSKPRLQSDGGWGTGQLDSGRKDKPILGLPLKSFVEVVLHLSVTDFSTLPCYNLFPPLAIFFRFYNFMVTLIIYSY